MKNLRDGFEFIWFLFLLFLIVITGIFVANTKHEFRVALIIVLVIEILLAIVIGIYLTKKHGDKK